MELWMPGADVHDIGNHAPCDGGPAKAIAHITWDKNATANAPSPLVPYADVAKYFDTNPTGMSDAPHVLWDPFEGRFTQFLPADSRSLSLVDSPGGTRTNRAGSVVIQVEALFFPYCTVGGTAYARLIDTPCNGWEELHAWISSLGVPDVWPMGRPDGFVGNRSESVWEKEGGWYGHSQVPENDHVDPGTWPDFIGGNMALTDADAAVLFNHKLTDALTGSPKSVADMLRYRDLIDSGIEKAIAAIKVNTLTDAQVASIAQGVATELALNSSFLNAISATVANELEKRLQA